MTYDDSKSKGYQNGKSAALQLEIVVEFNDYPVTRSRD